MGYSDPQEELERFVSKIRALCEQQAPTSEFLDLIMGALKGDVDAGEISDLTWTMAYKDLKDAIYDEARDDVYHQVKEQLDVQFADKKAVLEKDYATKIAQHEEQLQLGVMHEIVKDKLVSQDEFMDLALSKLKDDLLESKRNNLYPALFDATLQRVDQQDVIDFLAQHFKDELLEQYKDEIKNELLHDKRDQLTEEAITEIKDDLKNDSDFVNQARIQAIQEIARRIFE